MTVSGLPLRTLALFCKVVDNFGDIGICWRLARQLTHEHGLDVTLWVDDLQSFQRLCPLVSITATVQDVDGICVRHWVTQDEIFSVEQVSDIVIEFFGCDLPPGYVQTMAQRDPAPVWLNLEGLSAEDWVEGCHTLPSPHPQLALTKYFYFPGFTGRTGGLLREGELARQQAAFAAASQGRSEFLARFGVTDRESSTYLVSLFCYPNAPLVALFDAWQRAATPLTCLVPQGVAVDAIEGFLGAKASAGTSVTRGALTVRVIPFVAQPDYDKLLWSCNVNFVRGEDSFVRAQWAGKPFVWHIYPQDKNLHHVKLRAFLQRYAPATASLNDFSLHWNGAGADASLSDASAREGDWGRLWQALQQDAASIGRLAEGWQHAMAQHGDLASNLVAFANARHSSR